MENGIYDKKKIYRIEFVQSNNRVFKVKFCSKIEFEPLFQQQQNTQKLKNLWKFDNVRKWLNINFRQKKILRKKYLETWEGYHTNFFLKTPFGFSSIFFLVINDMIKCMTMKFAGV